MDELNDALLEAYCQGHADAVTGLGDSLGAAAVEAGKQVERARNDGFWDGFVEGLCARPAPYRRRGGRGLGRARPCRSLTRPPAAKPVAR